MTKQIITQERIKELLHYCPDTGLFTRLVDVGPRGRPGDLPGTLACNGYLQIVIDGVKYLSHRLAFLYMTGDFPENETDHINGIRIDNRWINLRPVTTSENRRNQKKRNDNRSGITGVCWCRHANRWRVLITTEKKRVTVGYYQDFFIAACARKSAELKYGYHKNHGR